MKKSEAAAAATKEEATSIVATIEKKEATPKAKVESKVEEKPETTPASTVTGKVASRPWGGVEADIRGIKTFETALRRGGLDFEVEKVPLFAPDGTEVEGSFGTQRTDSKVVLGVVGSKYEVIQNAEAFKFFEPFVDKSEAVFDTASALKGGRSGYVSMKLPSHISVKGDKSEIDLYALAINSHDMSYPLSMIVTPVRVVCENTMRLAMSKNNGMIRIRHTSSAEEKIKQAADMLAITNDYHKKLEEIFNAMAGKVVTKDKMKKIEEWMFPLNPEAKSQTRRDNQVDGFRNILATGLGQDECTEGTGYWVFSGMTRMLAEKAMEKEDRFDTVMYYQQEWRDGLAKILLS